MILFHGKVRPKSCNIIKYQLLKYFIREQMPEESSEKSAKINFDD